MSHTMQKIRRAFAGPPRNPIEVRPDENCQHRNPSPAHSLYDGRTVGGVTTDDGTVGWGETFGFTAIPAVKRVIDGMLAPELIGRDVALREKSMVELQKKFHVFGRSGAFIYGLSAIDIALWDIAGKV